MTEGRAGRDRPAVKVVGVAMAAAGMVRDHPAAGAAAAAAAVAAAADERATEETAVTLVREVTRTAVHTSPHSP